MVAITSLLALGDLEGAVGRFALDREAPMRLAGGTFLTCALLHGGWLHLLGDLYFLAGFGDHVEELLGPKRSLGLLALGVAAGGRRS